jgi:hypothetical protein
MTVEEVFHVWVIIVGLLVTFILVALGIGFVVGTIIGIASLAVAG